MNKSDLIEALAQRKNITQKDADLIVNLIFESMAEALEKGERIEIRGFGSLIVKQYESYVGRNPKTGEKVQVPEKKLPFFKVGKELKEKVDGKDAIHMESQGESVEGTDLQIGPTEGEEEDPEFPDVDGEHSDKD